MKRIIIDSAYQHTRVALVEDGELIELLWEDKSNESIVGNIYVGRVMTVLPGMSAAFVDIGDNKNAYWYYKNKNSSYKPKVGNEMLFQVEKASSELKGANVTERVSFPGKFTVLIPNDDGNIGISQKIVKTQERDRIKAIVSELLPEGYGIIIRTEGKGQTKEAFENEINSLYKKAEGVLNKGKYQKAPCILDKDFSWIIKAAKDLFDNSIDECIINNENEYKEFCDMAREYNLDLNKVILYSENIPIFEQYFLESQVQKALNKKVWLKSGGFLIIEQTEAMCVIDVNTGKFTGKNNIEKTILKTNLEAAKEIAKQIRLRNLSGIIIVDFIDMVSDEDKAQLKRQLEIEVKKDRIKTTVVGMTELGLMQITRKKTTPPLLSQLTVNCKCCSGTGRVYSIGYIVDEIKNQVISIFSQTIFDRVTIKADLRLLNMFSGKNNSFLKEIEKKYNKSIILEPISDRPYGYYEIIKEKSQEG